MKNYVQQGATLTLPAPYDVSSGDGALVGDLFGVASGDVLDTIDGEFQTEGVFDLTKLSAQAWTVGAKVYWDDTAKLCTTTVGSNTLIGYAVLAAANPSGVGRVKLTEF